MPTPANLLADFAPGTVTLELIDTGCGLLMAAVLVCCRHLDWCCQAVPRHDQLWVVVGL